MQRLNKRRDCTHHIEAGQVSMSSAPVEMLTVKRTMPHSKSRHQSKACRFCSAILRFVYPESGRAAVRPDMLLYLLLLGLASGLLGMAMEIVTDVTMHARRVLLRFVMQHEEAAASPSCDGAGCTVVYAVCWIGSSLALCWLSIFVTGAIAPTAAGSGIPEMKSILSGGMTKAQEASYLSFRTMVAKVVTALITVSILPSIRLTMALS